MFHVLQTGVCDEGCEDGWFKPNCDVECRTVYPNCNKCSTVCKYNKCTTKCTDCDDGYGLYGLSLYGMLYFIII